MKICHFLSRVAPGSIVSVSYCGQDAVNLNSYNLGHSKMKVSLRSSQNWGNKAASGDNNVVVMRGVGKASRCNTFCFKLRWTQNWDNRTCKISVRWLDSSQISHAVYEDWTKENGYFYCGTLRVKQYPCYYCYWVLIFPCQQVLSDLGIRVSQTECCSLPRSRRLTILFTQVKLWIEKNAWRHREILIFDVSFAR